MKAPIMITCLCLFIFSGCIQDVKSWEKEQLSKKTMQPNGGNSILKVAKEHVFFSKEASKGGMGVRGGGCGCN